jgi:MoxR-like ATPase
MAKLGIFPLDVFIPGRSTAQWTDAITDASEIAPGTLRLAIKQPGHVRSAALTEAVIDAVYSSTTNALIDVKVTLKVVPSPLTVARINRLLTGLDAPRLETYFRTGTLVWRMPGTPRQVQQGSNLFGIEGRLDAAGWAWYITAPYLTVAPTPAPVAPIASPTIAPQEPDEDPFTWSDGPVSAPVAPMKVTVAPSKADEDVLGLFEYPQQPDRIHTSADITKRLDAAWQRQQRGKRTVVALVGPAGTGKTSILDTLAADKGVGIFTFDAMGATSFADWVGQKDIVATPDGTGTITTFTPSSFITAIDAEGPYKGQQRIVRIDEVNRGETGAALNALMPILAQGRLFIPEANRTVFIDPAVMFTFTLNRGSAYSGTVTLDAALEDRVNLWIRLDYLPVDEEIALLDERCGLDAEQARPLVEAAVQVREIAARGEIAKGVSHRKVLDAADFVAAGTLTAAEAAEACWVDGYPDEGGEHGDRARVLLAIRSKLGA